MPTEKIGETVTVYTADHPPRGHDPFEADYAEARKWLMNVARGGCVICGGVPDMTHPELWLLGDPTGIEDHHGLGIYATIAGVPILVGQGLFPTEWSQGWAADPARFNALVAHYNWVLERLDTEPYPHLPITTTADVMRFVNSRYNASIKLCKFHHVAYATQHTPDANGHEAVGIHEIPGPIFWGQMTCEWTRLDMWGGTTGTIAVAPHPDLPGHVIVVHVTASHSDKAIKTGDVLPKHHAVSRLAHAGAHVDLTPPIEVTETVTETVQVVATTVTTTKTATRQGS